MNDKNPSSYSLSPKGLELLTHLIESKSITPNDCGLQQHIYQHLLERTDAALKNIQAELLIQDFSRGDTANSQIIIKPKATKNAVSKIGFIGHTDVVPAQHDTWSSNPFSLTINKDKLIGRGMVDMKGSIACFIDSLVIFIQSIQSLDFEIHIFLTSDEEGSGKDGLEVLFNQIKTNDFLYAIIGEPTSEDFIGDYIKVGRRGSVHGNLSLIGKQYHVAYPGHKNPFVVLPKVISTMNNLTFEEPATSLFTPSNLEITSISSEQTVENIIPSTISMRFNVRNTPTYPLELLKQNIQQALKPLLDNFDYKLKFRQGGAPWFSSIDNETLKQLLHPLKYQKTTKGGLSDGWKAHQAGLTNLFELGLKNKTAHQVDEYASLEDLNTLTDIYITILKNTRCIAP